MRVMRKIRHSTVSVEAALQISPLLPIQNLANAVDLNHLGQRRVATVDKFSRILPLKEELRDHRTRLVHVPEGSFMERLVFL